VRPEPAYARGWLEGKSEKNQKTEAETRPKQAAPRSSRQGRACGNPSRSSREGAAPVILVSRSESSHTLRNPGWRNFGKNQKFPKGILASI